MSAKQSSCINAVSRDDHSMNRDTIAEEWSLGVNTRLKANPGWALKCGAAQAARYERRGGWVFWSWKRSWPWEDDRANSEYWRWCYESAIANGVIPEDTTVAFHFAAPECGPVSTNPVLNGGLGVARLSPFY